MNDLSDNLQNLADNADRLSKQQSVNIYELMSEKFMRASTNYNSIDSFFSAAGINNQQEFDAYPDEDLDKFVAANSKFPDWESMQEHASQQWITDQLGL